LSSGTVRLTFLWMKVMVWADFSWRQPDQNAVSQQETVITFAWFLSGIFHSPNERIRRIKEQKWNSMTLRVADHHLSWTSQNLSQALSIRWPAKLVLAHVHLTWWHQGGVILGPQVLLLGSLLIGWIHDVTATSMPMTSTVLIHLQLLFYRAQYCRCTAQVNALYVCRIVLIRASMSTIKLND